MSRDELVAMAMETEMDAYSKSATKDRSEERTANAGSMRPSTAV